MLKTTLIEKRVGRPRKEEMRKKVRDMFKEGKGMSMQQIANTLGFKSKSTISNYIRR